MVKALAIDGGGIRGIIPALVLAEIERRTGIGFLSARFGAGLGR